MFSETENPMVRDELWPEPVFFRCFLCGGTTTNTDEEHTLDNGEAVCDNCYEEEDDGDDEDVL